MVSKVVVRHDGRVDGEPSERLGGLKAHRTSQDPRSKCLEEEQNEEVSGRGGHFKRTGNGPING